MSSTPNPDEAAAIAAAIERFSADLAPAEGEAERVGAWQRAALLEGVGAKRAVVDLEGEGGAKWLS